jgi:hypothetical protein
MFPHCFQRSQGNFLSFSARESKRKPPQGEEHLQCSSPIAWSAIEESIAHLSSATRSARRSEARGNAKKGSVIFGEEAFFW